MLTGNDIWSIINLNNIRPIAKGSNNTTFTDGTYAIKIGNVSQLDVDQFQKLAKTPYGIGLYGFASYITIPTVFADVIKQRGVYRYGQVDKTLYKVIGAQNVLVMELVTPLLKHGKEYKESYERRMYTLCDRIQNELRNTYNIYWGDNHPWNLGKRSKQIVIVDF